MKALSRWVLASLIAFLALVSVLLLADSAKAAPQCGAAEQVLTLLTDRYGEARIGEGIAGGGGQSPSDLRPPGRRHLVGRHPSAGREGLPGGLGCRLDHHATRIGDLTWHP